MGRLGHTPKQVVLNSLLTFISPEKQVRYSSIIIRDRRAKARPTISSRIVLLEDIETVLEDSSSLSYTDNDGNNQCLADITIITLKASSSSNIVPNDNKITFLTFHDRTGKPIYIGIRSYERSYIFRDNNGEYLSHRNGYKLEILHGYFPLKDPPN